MKTIIIIFNEEGKEVKKYIVSEECDTRNYIIGELTSSIYDNASYRLIIGGIIMTILGTALLISGILK